MAFNAKLDELRRHISYLHRSCTALCNGGYPSLSKRLGYRLDTLVQLSLQVDDLQQKLERYDQYTSTEHSTWIQIYSELTSIAVAIHAFRTSEFPAYQAKTQYDEFFSKLLYLLHREVGLDNIYPVVSLHQPGWFAVFPVPEDYPLYLVPELCVSDPGELPLVFHELGHVFLRHHIDLFDKVGQFLQVIMREKKEKVYEINDPNSRKNFQNALTEWSLKISYEREETISDIIGALLGGAAFTVAQLEGFLVIGSDPFISNETQYPPLDVRIRIGLSILSKFNPSFPAYDQLVSSWKQIQKHFGQPVWYEDLYDDRYISGIIEVVTEYLLSKNINIYQAESTGLRQQLTMGAGLRFQSPDKYSLWANETRQIFEESCKS